MKLKRLLALVLALSLILADAPAVYASGISSDDSEYQNMEEVSGNDVSGNLFLCPEETFTFTEAHGAPYEPSLMALAPSSSISVGPNPAVDSSNNISPDSIKYYRKYYNQIGTVGKLIYKALEQNYMSLTNPNYVISVQLSAEEAYSSTDARNGFMEGYAAFDFDNPQIFWLNPNAFTITNYKNEGGNVVKIDIKRNSASYTSFLLPPYEENLSLIESDKAAMEVYISEFVDKASDMNTLGKKIKSINADIAYLNYYNRYVSSGQRTLASKKAWESVSALTMQAWLTSETDKGDPEAPVCEGYARAFKIVCDKLGIPCILGCGNNHMWNYVQDDAGNWYGVDPTWNDNLRTDEWKDHETPEDQLNRYVLQGERFASNHPANGIFWGGGTPFDVPTLAASDYVDKEKKTPKPEPEPEPEPEPAPEPEPVDTNYLKPLEEKIKDAVDSGYTGTIEWTEGCAINNEIMQMLYNNPGLSFSFAYEYEGKYFEIFIPAGEAVNDDTYWYGPLWLAARYGSGSKSRGGGTALSGRRVYTIAIGDTLSKLAKRFDTTVSDLLKMNSYINNPDRIYAGDRLEY